MTDDTAFPVASVSKTFTAALILDLAEDGLLDLDASVRSYLPTLGISRKITVRQLLDHTSGLRDFFFHPRIDKACSPGRPRLGRGSLADIRRQAIRQAGHVVAYSNTNYLIRASSPRRSVAGTVAEQLRTRSSPRSGSIAHVLPVWSSRGPTRTEVPVRRTDPKLPAIDLSDGTECRCRSHRS